MRKSAIFFVVLFLLIVGSYVMAAVSPSDPAEQSSFDQQMIATATVMKNVSSIPLTFTENKGQWDNRVLYRADAGRAVAWFTTDGVTYQFSRPVAGQENMFQPAPGADPQPMEIKYEQITINAGFVNANRDLTTASEKMLDYKCNYFYGKDRSQWRTDVPSYESITYQNIYPGVDLKYYGNRQKMEYDFVVSPGADPSQIQIHYDGIKAMSVDADGQLVLETDWGTVTEMTPVVYQMNGGERIPLSGEYVINGDNSFGFKLSDEYNPELALVIDPVVSFSTFFGGAGSDYGFCIAVDDASSAYISGVSYSTDFPHTPGAFDTTGDANGDVFVTKFSPAGNTLVYSTFVGGTDYEWAYDIDLGTDGSAYVTGYTYSSDFPVTPGAIDSVYNTSTDPFVFRLTPSGDSLIYATYYGGSSTDYGYCIAVDRDGYAVISGYTYSDTDFPLVNAYDDTYNGGADVYIAKFTPSGDSILFSSYFGGSNGDYAYDIAIDDRDIFSIVGYTFSDNFPTVNAYDNTPDVSYADAFVTQFSAAGDTVLYSTYLGYTGTYDYGYRLNKFRPGISDNRYIYITGVSYNAAGAAFPTTPDAYDRTANGSNDIFAAKLAPAIGGTRSLVYSTLYGGSSSDYGWGIGVDENGNITCAGYTSSTNLPMVNSIYGGNSGSSDGFVAKFTPGLGAGNSLIFSTYFGGSNSEYPQNMALDKYDNVYLGFYTYSTNIPVVNAYQSTPSSSSTEAFAVKFSVFSADHTDITVGASNGNYSSMSVTHSGETDAPTGNIYYRLGGDISYTSGSFIPGTGVFTFNFPAGWTATRALEYYLELHSGPYDEYVGGASNPIAYTPILTNTQGRRPNKTEALRFKMIGVPIAVTGSNSCPAVFADDLGGNYKSNWRLASYNTENHRYAEYAGSAPVEPGVGYWLITKGEADYGAVGRAVQPNRTYASNYYYEVALDSGWNLVANPFPFNISLVEILLEYNNTVISGLPDSLLDPQAYWYSGTDYVTVTTIPGWDAVFVNLKKKNVTALFPYHRAGAAKKLLPMANAYPAETGSSDWQIQFRLKAGDIIDDGNFVGVRSDALEGIDNYDYGEPPPPPGGPSLALKSNPDDTYLKRCDYRPPFDDGAEWYLTFTELPKRILTVSGIEDIPYNMDAWLILDDKSKMHLEDGIVINLPDGVTSARLVIGDENYLKDNGSIVVPKTFVLDQNYPNPFNPITTIKFALPEPSSVRLEVYNLLGQRVTTLIDKELPAGDYTTVWQGTDDAGQEVASGMYFYRIEAGKYKASKKMMLLK
jgi:hypothetical protein